MKVHIDKILVGTHEIPVDLVVDDRTIDRRNLMDILALLDPPTDDEDDLMGQTDLEEFTPKRGPGRPRKGG